MHDRSVLSEGHTLRTRNRETLRKVEKVPLLVRCIIWLKIYGTLQFET